MRILPAFLVGLVWTVLGCQHPVSVATQPGVVHISIGPSTKAVVADWVSTITPYDVVLHCTSRTLPDLGATVAAVSVAGGANFAEVTAGTWTVGITALNAAGKVLGVGTLANQVVGYAAGLSVTVPVVRTQTGTGDFSFTFSFPQAVADTVAAQLYTASGAPVGSPETPTMTTAVVDDQSASVATIARTAIASGAYRLELTFTKGAAVVGVYDEAVNVWDNVVSDRWLDGTGNLVSSRDFQANQFASTNASLSALAASVSGEEVSLNPGFSSSVYTYYVTAASASFSPPTRQLATQTVRYQVRSIGTSASAAWADFGAQVTVALGNVLFVQVTAPDGQTKQVYQVTVGTAVSEGNTVLSPIDSRTVEVSAASLSPAMGQSMTFQASFVDVNLAPVVASAFAWYLDGTRVPADEVDVGDSTSSWTWTPTVGVVQPGLHQVQVVAIDAATGIRYSGDCSLSTVPLVVTYSGNGNTGGTVPVPAQTYVYGAPVVVQANACGLAKANNTFLGWNTASDGSGTNYTAGQTLTLEASVTLYARWTTSTPTVGQTGPGTGYVFYDKGYYSDGWQFLEVSATDLAKSGVPWATTLITPPLTNGGLGKGFGDVYTAQILALAPVGTAAVVCQSYTGGGYSDWYLPTVDELAKIDTVLYQNSLGGLNSGLGAPGYWSSDYKLNPGNGGTACWYRNFTTHEAWNDWAQTSTSFGVRAVRAF